jgi:exportin-1
LTVCHVAPGRFATDEALFRKEATFVNKLNVILVQILKHDWPARWKSFIPGMLLVD